VPPVSRTYWRSLAELDQSPESRAFLEREFQEGASELPEGITRRDMITLLGASMSIAGLAGCDIIRRPVENIVPYVNAPEDIVPGIPRYYATTMPFHRSAYGVIVESHEGRPTKSKETPRTLRPSGHRARAFRHPWPLRSRPLASSETQGASEILGRFRDGWAEFAKAHAGMVRRPRYPSRVLLLSDSRATTARVRALSEGTVARTTPSATRTARGPQVMASGLDLMLQSISLGHSSLRRRPLLTDAEMIRHAEASRTGSARAPRRG
jgi:MoCo/4Fe-4S cofactor protein with predicted Tat translocation signal